MAKKLYFKPIARLTFATDVVDQNRKIGKEWCPAGCGHRSAPGAGEKLGGTTFRIKKDVTQAMWLHH